MSGEIAQRESREVVVSHEAAYIERIIAAASDPAVDVEKFERMMAMAERMQAKQAEQAFNRAMTAAQRETRRVAADANNQQTRSKYATYAALDRALRPIYTEHGFSLSYDTGDGAPEQHVRVLCYVSHDDGHSRTYKTDMPADGKGAKGGDVMTKTHAAGSAMSYGMRYLLKMIFNVAVGEDDDDGNGAASPPINAEQVKRIESLIKSVGADRGQFIGWLKRTAKVDSIEALNQRGYESAVRALEAKRQKEAKQ